MSEWKEVRLGDTCTIFAGGDAPKNRVSKVQTERFHIPIFSNGITDEGLYGYTDEAKVYEPATTISARGTIGVSFRRVVPYFPIVRLISVIGNKDTWDADFLYYRLKKSHISGDGSVQAQLTVPMISNYTFNIPALPTQRRIAAILSSLDAKIENNNKVNAKLEEIVQNLFKEWFVDFGPFKDGKFVDSELGPIPEGWRVVSLGEIIETTSGGTPSRKNDEFYIDGFYNWVKSKELNGGYIITTEELITDDAIDKSSAKLLPSNSVLIAMYGATVGEFGIISKEMTCNQAICALLPNDKVPYSFLFMLAKNKKEELINMAVGSAQQNISQVMVKGLKIAYNEDICLKFHTVVKPIFEKMKIIEEENQRLATLRDTLLPKLMSGEIEV